MFIGKIAQTGKDGFLLAQHKGDTGFFKLSPVFDYSTPTQVGQGGITKIPVLTPHDMTSDECATWVTITGITFFEDMKEEDRKRYKSFVVATRDEMLKKRVKETSGLHLVDARGRIKE